MPTGRATGNAPRGLLLLQVAGQAQLTVLTIVTDCQLQD